MNFKTLDADRNMILTKHFTKGRAGKKVEFIGLHHNAGNLSIEGCYNVWQTREASAHYQVQSDGKIGQLVWDRDTAWALGNFDANQRSINIEHANNNFGPWTISEACLDSGAHLVAALCIDYNLGRPVWGKNVKPHSAISATACPGEIARSQRDAYMARAQKYYDEMTGASAPSKPSEPSRPSSVGYIVRIDTDVLRIRKGPGTNYAQAGTVKRGEAYTIVAESGGPGANKWGKLKSGAGWISLDFVDRVNGSNAPAKKSVDEVAREVIRGDWGNGSDRANRLRAAGYDPDAVQRRVNQLM